MLNFFSDNIGTIIVAAVLSVIIGAIVFSIIRNKKKGKNSCSCGCTGCAGCAMKDSCHPKKTSE